MPTSQLTEKIITALPRSHLFRQNLFPNAIVVRSPMRKLIPSRRTLAVVRWIGLIPPKLATRKAKSHAIDPTKMLRGVKTTTACNEWGSAWSMQN